MNEIFNIDSTLGESRIRMDLDLRTGAFSVGLSSAASTTACVATCGVASLSGAAMECWHKVKSSKNRKKDFIACMKAKGINIASDYVKCVIACMSGAAFS